MRIPKSPPQIASLTDELHRPMWSVMIPTYNCSNYLIETIKSVLLQDIGEDNMQIEVVDDCSTDANVQELIQIIGQGRVKYYRQKQNVGSLRNFETCISRSRGKYIHLLHGDDRIKKGYYVAITEVFEKFPNAGAAFCAWEHIDSHGVFSHQSRLEANTPCILENWLYKLAEHPRLQYVAMTVKREVYEKVGSYYLANYGEDWEMWARIAKDYDTAYIPEFLAEYREHENSITWRSYQTGQNIKDINKVIKIIGSYLPKINQRASLKNAKKNYALWILNETFRVWLINKNNKTVYNQIKSILVTYTDKDILSKIVSLLRYIWSAKFRKTLKKIFN